ncbi:phosphatidate cytidylyltransferase [Paenisporosarcina sp. TG-14]|uniref:phosphatidate cytidylyltransferase n=1 Tax=Paenisporosarcina sp. TG-14 TaxID=1231057 RepID=UPI0002F195DC|nr:phosphatidate cytidylyltransferase [Paenisporosarcina sp. TG-14]
MKQRMITGVIAAGLFIPIVVLGGLPFTLLVYAMAAVGLFEILRMKGLSIFSVHGFISLFALFIFLIPSKWSILLVETTGYTKIDFALMAVLLLLTYTVVVKNRFTFEDAAFSILAALYVGIGFFYFIETRLVENGLQFVIFALLIIWTTDSGAYFTGKKFGKNKLWPEISPNKTIEGFYGGIAVAIIFAVIFQWISPISSSYTVLIVVTILASVFGQVGDLVESALKRHYNVKDSGNLLPGHGGVLDRFDSLLFVLPLLHFLHFVG